MLYLMGSVRPPDGGGRTGGVTDERGGRSGTRPGTVRVKAKVADPREDPERDTSLELTVRAWHHDWEVARCGFTPTSAQDAPCILPINAPGKVELRPMSEVTWRGHLSSQSNGPRTGDCA